MPINLESSIANFGEKTSEKSIYLEKTYVRVSSTFRLAIGAHLNEYTLAPEL